MVNFNKKRHVEPRFVLGGIVILSILAASIYYFYTIPSEKPVIAQVIPEAKPDYSSIGTTQLADLLNLIKQPTNARFCLQTIKQKKDSEELSGMAFSLWDVMRLKQVWHGELIELKDKHFVMQISHHPEHRANFNVDHEPLLVDPSNYLIKAIKHYDISLLNYQLDEDNRLSLRLAGSFAQLTALIALLRHFPLSLRSSHWQWKNEVLKVNLELDIQENSMPAVPFSKLTTQLQNPFCETVIATQQDFSIKDIKMVGLLEQANEKMALIKLPDENIQVLSLQTTLGLEKARVISIETQKIVLQLANKNNYEIIR